MRAWHRLLVGGVVLVLLSIARPATAQRIGYFFAPYHPGYFGYWTWRVIDDRPLPYFAAHPPVYYSGQITARPYGWSPFAFLPAVEPVQRFLAKPTPAQPSQKAVPKRIKNPYANAPVTKASQANAMERAAGSAPTAQRNAADGLELVVRVGNPFFHQANAVPASTRESVEKPPRVLLVKNPFVALE